MRKQHNLVLLLVLDASPVMPFQLIGLQVASAEFENPIRDSSLLSSIDIKYLVESSIVL